MLELDGPLPSHMISYVGNIPTTNERFLRRPVSRTKGKGEMRFMLFAALVACTAKSERGPGEEGSSSAEDGEHAGEIGPSELHPGLVGDEPDADGDGWSESRDCNDGDEQIHPYATEVDEDVDEDCDGFFDEGEGDDPAVFCEDRDGDGFGSRLCGLDGGVHNDNDCDDANSNMAPSREEVEDNDLDDDCDGVVDERYYQASMCVQTLPIVEAYEVFAASYNNPDGSWVGPAEWDVTAWDELETEVTGSVDSDEAPEVLYAEDNERHCATFSAIDGGRFIVSGLARLVDGRIRPLDYYTAEPPTLMTVWTDGTTANCTFEGFHHYCERPE